MRLFRPAIAVLFGVTLFWGGLEAVTRVVFSQVISYDVEMWRYARDVKVWGRTPGIRFEHRPESATRLMGVAVRTNSDGLRDREFTREHAAGIYRVAALGDSVTFGWGVPEAAAYPKVLESLLGQDRVKPGVEVMNFGVGNYTTADEAALFEDRVLSYDPDLVLLGVFVNDAEEAGPGPSGGALGHSLAAVWVWGRVDALLRRMGWRESFEEYYLGLYEPQRAGLKVMREALGRIAKGCRERGIPWVAAMLPDLHRLEHYPFRKVHAWVRDEVESRGGIFVDLLPALDGVEPGSVWVAADDAHPNEEAHLRYARHLVAEVDWPGLLERRVASEAD